MTIRNILMVGVGGQGILLSSDILATAAMLDGHDVKKSEVHGMSQRGGSVFSHIRYGEKVHSPVIPRGEANVLFALEEMETLRWLEYAAPDCRVIVLKNRILPAETERYPDGVETEIRKHFPDATFIEPEAALEKTGDKKTLNVLALGTLAKRVDLSETAWRAAIAQRVPKGTEEKNLAAFVAGMAM